MIKFRILIAAVFVLVGCGANDEEKSESVTTSADCPHADTADATAITQERADKLIGFTESDAESCATSLGWAFRVGERDGEGFALTADYSQQRVTVSVANDLVIAVAVGLVWCATQRIIRQWGDRATAPVASTFCDAHQC